MGALTREQLDEISKVLPPNASSKKVALFGGSFNPPHIAHALVVHSILLTHDVDEVWVMPAGDHPFGKKLAPFDERMHMCRLAFAHLGEQVKVLPVENMLPHPTYSVQTLEALHSLVEGFEPYFIIGTDILDELHLWREPERLQTLSKFLILPRQGYQQKGVLEFEIPNISSSEIRRRLSEGDDRGILGMVAKSVSRHIDEQNLYRAQK